MIKKLNTKNKKSNTNKGITLIALIITIIVMLILVAVTINMAVNGGLFGYAGKAVVDTHISEEKEYITFAVSTIKMKKYANNDNTPISAKELEEELKKYEKGVTVKGTNNLVIAFESGREYTINQEGEFDLETGIEKGKMWKQFAPGCGELLGLGIDGNVYIKHTRANTSDDTEFITMLRNLIKNNGRVIDISALNGCPVYIMQNGKAYFFGDEISCINDDISLLQEEKIVKTSR